MIGIDLFAGCGGLSLGATWAGVNVHIAVELDPITCQTYTTNNNKTNIINDDIKNINFLDVGERNEDLIIFGGPPCQGFSTSNQRTRNNDNKNNWLFLEFLRTIEMLHPEWIVFENVAGILQTNQGSFIHAFEMRLKELGYQLLTQLLNAFDFGVPQKRQRCFIVGSQKIKPSPIEPPLSKCVVTVEDAIGDLPILQNGDSVDVLPYRTQAQSTYAKWLRGDLTSCSGHLVTRNTGDVIKRYPYIPQGGNWENIPEALMESYSNRLRCHTGIYRRLSSDEPSVVIGNFRKNMLIHPTQNRGLSVREAARIQSFPDHYVFSGSIGFQQQQVGNAVPPLLAKAVFEHIVKLSNKIWSNE